MFVGIYRSLATKYDNAAIEDFQRFANSKLSY